MKEIQFFDEATNKFYKLIPTKTWPALQISGILMHRIDGTDPKKDAITKIRSLGRIYGRVLDTCAGLGYTAILAARKRFVSEVVAVEKDENVLEIAKQNPFSQELFENQKIQLVIADVSEYTKELPEKYFNFIIHDPPRISIAGELYSKDFYKELYRVLKPRGKLFHYVGRPGRRRRKDYVKGVMQRLECVGFRKIKKVGTASGVVCFRVA